MPSFFKEALGALRAGIVRDLSLTILVPAFGGIAGREAVGARRWSGRTAVF